MESVVLLPDGRADITIPINTARSNAFRFGPYQFLAIKLPAAWTAADLRFVGCRTKDGTFALVAIEDGTLPGLTAAVVAAGLGRWVILTERLRGAPEYLEIASLAAGAATDVNQAAATTFEIAFK